MSPRIRVERSSEKALAGLPPHRQTAAVKSVKLFNDDPSYDRLKFRPLAGRKRYFLINASGGDRIILRLDRDAIHAVVDVGPHDNILRRWNRRESAVSPNPTVRAAAGISTLRQPFEPFATGI